MKARLSQLRDVLEILQKLTAIFALIIGGIWTYTQFIQHREFYPRANISHQISDLALPDSQTLLRVRVSIENSGNTLLEITKGEVRIQRVLPLSRIITDNLHSRADPIRGGPQRLPWPAIRLRHLKWAPREFHIEPGETQQIDFDFVIPSDIRAINAYSWIQSAKNDASTSLGWSSSTLYRIRQLEE